MPDIPAQLRSAATRVYRDGGYGDVYWNSQTGGVFYCTGDWYPNDKVRASKELLANVPGVKSVEVEAECKPSPREQWVKVNEVTTSGAVGGFQSCTVMDREHVDRFHRALKKALGQEPSDEEDDIREQSMVATKFRANQSVFVHFGSGGGSFETRAGRIKSVYKVEGDSFIDVVLRGDSSDDPTTFMWNGQDWVLYAEGEDEEVVDIQAESSGIVGRIDRALASLSEAGGIDDAAAEELRLFIDNDAQLDRQMTSIIKNVMTKIGQGRYDRNLAVKLFMYLVDAGAQKYVKEFSDDERGMKWHDRFPKKTREAVATALRDYVETEAAIGNYNNHLPAKYANIDVAAALKKAGAVVEARDDYENVSIYNDYYIAVSADTQRSDGKPYFVNIHAMDPRDFYNGKERTVYKDGFRTVQQAITWARGEISRGDVPFAAGDDE